MKKSILLLIAAFATLVTNAHDFEVGGIYYNITSSTTVEVTYQGSYGSEYTEYTGSITIPATVTYEGVNYSVTSIGDEAFSYCSSLTAITITEGLTSIGEYAFYDCSSLTAITITEGVTIIGSYAFYGCSSLTTITIPASVTGIGYGAFNGHSGLLAITIPEGVTNFGLGAFSYCNSLTNLTIPESVTSIGEQAFEGCSSLTAINIPEGVTSIRYRSFHGCSNLTEITLPENVTSIGVQAFEGCSSLTAINIPESVTSIGLYAFANCSSLTTITIPKGVTSIENGAFSGCSSLTTITCNAATPPTIYPSTFLEVDKSIPIYVPAGSVEAYKAAAYWSEFTNILPIEEPTPDYVTITINQYGSGTYSSAYALDFNEVQGLKAYAAAGYDTETGVVTLLRVNTAKAGIGLFVKGTPGETYQVPIIESTSSNVLNMLVATSEQVSVGARSSDGRYANYKYTILQGTSEPLFYCFEEGFSLGAGKAYLQIPVEWLPAKVEKARSIRLRFDNGDGTYDDEGTTEIDDAEFNIHNSELVYDLMGRRVTSPQKGGLYIVDGKKVIY